MNLTSMWRTAAFAMVISSGACVAPAAAQSAGDDVEMERIVIAMPNGKRIIRYVPRTTRTGGGTGNSDSDAPEGVRPPSDGDGDDSGDGGGDDDAEGDLWTPTDVPDDLARQVAMWLEYYRNGDMRADVNGDGRLNPSDYTALLASLRGPGDSGQDDGTGGNGDSGDNGDNGDGGDGGDGDGDDGGGSDTTTGWTDLSPVAGSRVIYVSSSQGSDSNDGLSQENPVRSLSRGMSKLRDGHPDWLLFKRGDTFTGSFGRFDFSGESSEAPLVVGAYGTGNRPKIITGTSAAFNLTGPKVREHVAIMSLHMEPGSGHPSGGIRVVSGTLDDLLIEDCLLKEYSVNILVQGEASSAMTNIRIRRNVLIDAMGQSHSQGIYASSIQGLTVEGNIVDRNGWDHDIGRSDATIFAHNCYIQRTVHGLVFKDNIVMRASSHGLQARMGGTVEGNIFFRNPMAIMFGNEGSYSNEYAVEGTIKHNVILEGVNIHADLNRGNGIVIQHTASIQVTDNILSHNSNGPSGAYGISIDGPNTADVRNALIANNVIYDWDLSFRVHDYNAVSVTFRDNVLSNSEGTEPLVRHRRRETVGAVDYIDNHYMRSGNNDWFRLGSSGYNLNEWQNDYANQAQQFDGSFVDADRTLDSYARSIGLSGVDALIEQMRSVRKGSWDERYTPAAIAAYFREGFAIVGG